MLITIGHTYGSGGLEIGRRLAARLWQWTGRRAAWSRLAGSGLLLLGTVRFLVLLAALLLRALY